MKNEYHNVEIGLYTLTYIYFVCTCMQAKMCCMYYIYAKKFGVWAILVGGGGQFYFIQLEGWGSFCGKGYFRGFTVPTFRFRLF